jgi:phosphohistidine phosphatase
MGRRLQRNCDENPRRIARIAPWPRAAGMLDSPAAEIDFLAMRRLILLRHAKSDWTGIGLRDQDRGLASRGRDSAPLVGAYMAHHALMPDLVLVSTATRARDTWGLVAEAFRKPPPIVYEERLYETGPKAILEAIQSIKRDVHVLLVVGHNPGLRDLAELLIASGDVDARQRLLEKFPTAGLAVIDFPVDDWGKLHPKSGRLDRFVAPRQLDMATD